MQRYRLQGEGLALPPRCGVTRSGRAVSSFAWRVQHDADFAIENGYYPKGEVQPTPPPEREGYRTEVRWYLEQERWQCRYVQYEAEGEILS